MLIVLVVNVGLVLTLFGAREGADRLMGDWRRIVAAQEVERGVLTVQEAFDRIYGAELGPSPSSAMIRDHVARDLEIGEPAVFDVILARYILDRFGAIDGRTLPAGVYLAAGPIGPDAWPGPLLTQYVVFPRHGYLLVVPPRRGDAWPTAYEATASLREEFRQSGDNDALYAVVQDYRPGAYDFPTAGEPIHDLLRISDAPAGIPGLETKLTSLRETLDHRGLTYRLLRRNSNTALACYLHAVRLSSAVDQYVGSNLLLRLRLPGIYGGNALPC